MKIKYSYIFFGLREGEWHLGLPISVNTIAWLIGVNSPWELSVVKYLARSNSGGERFTVLKVHECVKSITVEMAWLKESQPTLAHVYGPRDPFWWTQESTILLGQDYQLREFQAFPCLSLHRPIQHFCSPSCLCLKHHLWRPAGFTWNCFLVRILFCQQVTSPPSSCTIWTPWPSGLITMHLCVHVYACVRVCMCVCLSVSWHAGISPVSEV